MWIKWGYNGWVYKPWYLLVSNMWSWSVQNLEDPCNEGVTGVEIHECSSVESTAIWNKNINIHNVNICKSCEFFPVLLRKNLRLWPGVSSVRLRFSKHVHHFPSIFRAFSQHFPSILPRREVKNSQGDEALLEVQDGRMGLWKKWEKYPKISREWREIRGFLDIFYGDKIIWCCWIWWLKIWRFYGYISGDFDHFDRFIILIPIFWEYDEFKRSAVILIAEMRCK